MNWWDGISHKTRRLQNVLVGLLPSRVSVAKRQSVRLGAERYWVRNSLESTGFFPLGKGINRHCIAYWDQTLVIPTRGLFHFLLMEFRLEMCNPLWNVTKWCIQTWWHVCIHVCVVGRTLSVAVVRLNSHQSGFQPFGDQWFGWLANWFQLIQKEKNILYMGFIDKAAGDKNSGWLDRCG